MKKWIKYSLLTIVLLLLIGGVTLVVCLNGIIKGAVEKGGTMATKSATTLDKAELNLFSGHLQLKGFDLKNPDGFEPGSSFIKFGLSEVQVQPMSLASGQIEIDTLNLDGLELSYIKPDSGKANYEVILDNVNSMLPAKSGEPAPKEAPKEKTGPGKAIHVGLIKFTNAKVHASVSVLGQPVKVTVPLLNFEMKDVLVKDGGTGALTAQITQELVAQLIKQAPEIAKAALESAKGNLKGIDVKGATDTVKGLGSLFKK